jgi:hypothetical protein
MNWFRSAPEADPDDFWRQTAAKRGGEILFRTFATLLGRSGGRRLDLPGLLYAVGGTLWFEDFERESWLAKIIPSRQKYEKTELSFSMAEIRQVRGVSRSTAARCIGGAVPAERLPKATALTRMFSAPVTQLILSDGSALFFDILQRKEFIALFPQ